MDVIVADKETRVRSALRLLLEQQPEICSVVEAGETRALLLLMQKARPALVLLDWHLAGKETPQLLLLLHEIDPGVKVVALSLPADDGQPAFTSGVDYSVSKADPPERLLSTVRVALEDCKMRRSRQ